MINNVDLLVEPAPALAMAPMRRKGNPQLLGAAFLLGLFLLTYLVWLVTWLIPSMSVDLVMTRDSISLCFSMGEGTPGCPRTASTSSTASGNAFRCGNRC